MDCIIDGTRPCAKIMRNCAWDMLLKCSRSSTTPCWDCSLGKEHAMSLMLDANSPIFLIKPLPPWGLKGEFDFATALSMALLHLTGTKNGVIILITPLY